MRNCCTFSPASRCTFGPALTHRIVTASSDNTARIWDAATGKQIAPLEGHTGGVNSASFSADGHRIVTASSDKTARIWDAATGKQIAPLEGWDVSRSESLISTRAILLTAALAHGIGWRTDAEASDLLMQDAEPDLYAEALKQRGRTPDDPEIAAVAASLHARLHPNCYLSPTQLAEKYRVEPAGKTEAPITGSEAADPDAASDPPAPSKRAVAATVATPARAPRRRRWHLWLWLIVVLLLAALAGVIVTGQIDIVEIMQQFERAVTR